MCRKVQQALVDLGILAADQVDGFYGSKTEQAVKTLPNP